MMSMRMVWGESEWYEVYENNGKEYENNGKEYENNRKEYENIGNGND
jgi:hypothetical protein